MSQRIVLIGLLLSPGNLMAGVVSFDPAVTLVDPAVSSSVDVALHVRSDGMFDAVDLRVYAPELTLASWSYADEFSLGTVFNFTILDPFRCLGGCLFGTRHQVDVGGFLPNPVDSGELGTLSISVASLGPGEYTIWTDSASDGGGSALSLFGKTEPVSGFGKVVVVPEPMSFVCVLTVAAFAIGTVQRRRREWPGG